VHFFKYVPLIDADFTITVGVDHVKTGAPFFRLGAMNSSFVNGDRLNRDGEQIPRRLSKHGGDHAIGAAGRVQFVWPVL
jgi:hypothetical protein